MQKLEINGPTKLHGTIKVAGSKNHVLPMMAACLLSKKEIILHNVPAISDVETMAEILRCFGVRVEFTQTSLIINAENARPAEIPAELTEKLRASIVIVGPALSRFGKIKMAEPGGDQIGARPLDTHFHAFEKMGVKIQSKENILDFEGKPNPGVIVLDELSVTATENIILAAVCAKGTTQIRLSACEPHVVGLCGFLNQLGARISGIGSHVLTIEGVDVISGGEGVIVPDYLEAGTLAIATAACSGDVVIEDFIAEDLDALINCFDRVGVNYELLPRKIHIYGHQKLKATKIRTDIFPGFPSDLQAPMAVLLTQAKGTSEIFETMYEGRLQYLFELQRMGARVNIRDSHVGLIEGPTTLHGTELVSFDIRAGATILIAALIAEGKTTIDRIEHIDRAYEYFDGRLRALGANLIRTG